MLAPTFIGDADVSSSMRNLISPFNVKPREYYRDDVSSGQERRNVLARRGDPDWQGGGQLRAVDDSATVLRRKRRRRGSATATAPWLSVAATSARGGRERSRGPYGGVCVDCCCCCRRGRSADKAAGYPKYRPAPRRRTHSISLTMPAAVIPLPPCRCPRLQHTSRPI